MYILFGSNRKGNCYQLAQDLKQPTDEVISLAGKDIKYCTGCCKCSKRLENYCVLQDDMQEIYKQMAKANNIIIITPIYMNHITGILKNVIDRWNRICFLPRIVKW
ncbi:MAG: flavodoxin family protein [Clostridia bacterium]|nr:flavodoxin family protein [Clostridia bacterium]